MSNASSNGHLREPSFEDAVGDAFVRLLNEVEGQQHVSTPHRVIQAFATEVRRRKEHPGGGYSDFLDLAASAAVRVMVYGPDCHDDHRKDPAPLLLYRRMRWLVNTLYHNGGGPHPVPHPFEAIQRQDIVNESYGAGYSAGLAAARHAEEQQHDWQSAFMYAAGQRAERERVRLYLEEASRRTGVAVVVPGVYPVTQPIQGPQPPAQQEQRPHPSRSNPHPPPPPPPPPPPAAAAAPAPTPTSAPPTGNVGTAAPRSRAPRRHIESSGSVGAHGSPVPAPQPSAAFLELAWSRAAPQVADATKPAQRQTPDSRPAPLGRAASPTSTYLSLDRPENTPPAEASAPSPSSDEPDREQSAHQPSTVGQERDSNYRTAACEICGQVMMKTGLMRHRRRQHRTELAAAGIELNTYPCFITGCTWGDENFEPISLRVHLQRLHNFNDPDSMNYMTENLKYIGRMPREVMLTIIAEAGQQLNAVKTRTKKLEDEHRRRNSAYISRHALPNIEIMHETRPAVLEMALADRKRQPLAIIELRQLTRARGMRTMTRGDEGTWWEVADDLEAALYPDSLIAQAIAALPAADAQPSVFISKGILTEDPPNMNDPGWVPRYAPLAQTVLDDAGAQGEGEGSVAPPPGVSAPSTSLEAAAPASHGPNYDDRDVERRGEDEHSEDPGAGERPQKRRKLPTSNGDTL